MIDAFTTNRFYESTTQIAVPDRGAGRRRCASPMATTRPVGPRLSPTLEKAPRRDRGDACAYSDTCASLAAIAVTGNSAPRPHGSRDGTHLSTTLLKYPACLNALCPAGHLPTPGWEPLATARGRLRSYHKGIKEGPDWRRPGTDPSHAQRGSGRRRITPRVPTPPPIYVAKGKMTGKAEKTIEHAEQNDT